MKEFKNKIIHGNAIEVLKTLPENSVDCCITSPPYFGLRNYKTSPQIWDGDPKCNHKFNEKEYMNPRASGSDTNASVGNTLKKLTKFKIKEGYCIKCGAWQGELGLEPAIELYINHLCDVFSEAGRALKDTGTLWVNIADSYHNATKWTNKAEAPHTISKGLPEKSLCGIPERFVLEMSNRGWVRRNTIIWFKPNCMPASTRNRFTIDFEYIYFFTKSNDAKFWTNEKTFEVSAKKPAGIKGTEGIDWDWYDCPNCSNHYPVDGANTGDNNKEPYQGNNPHLERLTKITKEDAETVGSPRARYHRHSKKSGCKRCDGTGKVKYSNWSGHDYYFEMQYEPYATKSIERLQRAISDSNKWVMGADGQSPHNLSQPRDNVKYKSENGAAENCAINSTIFKGKDKLVAMPKGLINQFYYNGQAVKDYGSADVQNPSDTQRRILAGIRNTIGLSENESKFFDDNKPTNSSRLADYRNASRMPPIGGLKQTAGNDNPVYSGNQPNWTRTGRNKRCVWQITTKGFAGAHFAVFPPDLIEIPILAGSPEAVCTKCGLPRVKVFTTGANQHSIGATSGQYHEERDFTGDNTVINTQQFTVHASCKCGAKFKKSVVLDPFMGSGTTAVVAKKLNRNYIGIELNPDYIKMAEKRINNTEKPLF